MKKCPKCGTILDDSKKQCYMCGTDLDDEEQSFEESFSMQLSNDVKKDENVMVDNSVSFSTNNNYDTELNKLNSMDFDERNGLQKNIDSFFNKEKGFKNKESLIAEKKALEGERQKALQEQKNLKEEKERAKEEKKKNAEAMVQQIKEEKRRKKEEEKAKNERKALVKKANNKFLPSNTNFPSFSEDEQYINDFSGFSKVSNKKNDSKNYFANAKRKKINLAPLFNIVCIIVAVVGIYFVYDKFIKDKDSTDGIGGLKYVMPEDLKLESSDGSNRYYTYGQSCSVRISYGATSLGDTFIDNYIASQKEAFENEEGATPVYEELKINDNKWKSMNILYVMEDEQSEEGFKSFIKYKYTSIFFNGNFYHVVLVNARGNDECLSLYNQFLETLTFE